MPAWLARRDEMMAHLIRVAESAQHTAREQGRDESVDRPVDAPASGSAGAQLAKQAPSLDVSAVALSPAVHTSPVAEPREEFALVAAGELASPSGGLAPVALALDEPVFVPADDAPLHAADRAVLDHIDQRRGAARVREVVMDVIATESPIEATRLGRIVGRRFGLQRVTTKRSDAIVSLVPRKMIDRGPLGTFVWAEGTSPDTYTVFRSTPEGVDRPLHEIAPQEIANAMSWVVGASHGAGREETLRETAAVFGVGRLTAQIRERLERVLDSALASGDLSETDGLIHG
jgi:hypothetical protein